MYSSLLWSYLLRHRFAPLTNTSVQINHNTPVFGHAACLGPSPFRMLTRARSAPLPVESVSDNDMDDTVFKLGRLRSFAKGVAP